MLGHKKRGGVKIPPDHCGSAAVYFLVLKLFKLKNNNNINQTNEFSNLVKLRLEKLGFQVRERIGFNNVIVDLAVQNPFKQNHFILGIECDEGVLQHIQYIKDKTILKPQLLIKQGWVIEKIYSVDWLTNPEEEVLRLYKILQNLIHAEQEKISQENEFQIQNEVNVSTFEKNQLNLRIV